MRAKLREQAHRLSDRDRAGPHARCSRRAVAGSGRPRSASDVADALGLSGDAAALPLVEPLVKDRDPQVARAAERGARAPARRRRSAARVDALPRSFYDRPTLDVARDLLGKVLVHVGAACVTSGVIVEVEAYIGESDPACHAAPGPTRRNEPLYGPPGHAYVYLNYGIHCLVNVVTEPAEQPAAVLIRALDPLDGIDIMRRRRRARDERRRRLAGVGDGRPISAAGPAI